MPQPAPTSPDSEPYLAPHHQAPASYQSQQERPSIAAEPVRPYPASRKGLPWTSTDDTLLITHLQQHAPIAEIAPLLQRSEKAVVRRMGRLRKAEVIPFVLYIHYYDNDSAFDLHRKTKPASGRIPQ